MITLNTQFSIVYNVAKTLQQRVCKVFFQQIRNSNQSYIQSLISRYCGEDSVLLHCDTIILTEYIYQTIDQHKSSYQPNTTYDNFIASFHNTLLNSTTSEWDRRNGLMGMSWAQARFRDWSNILCAGVPPFEQYSTLFENRDINELYYNPTAVIKIAKKYYEEETRCIFCKFLMQRREQFFIFENAPEITKSYISSSGASTGDLDDIRTYREILEQEGLWH